MNFKSPDVKGISSFIEIDIKTLNHQQRNTMPYNGEWWPIWNPKWWSPGVSRHPLDPYSFVHIQTGLICFWAIGFPLWYFLEEKDVKDLEVWPLWVGFGIVFLLSAIFEIVENAECTIEKYREGSGTSSDYEGDSYQNILADVIVVQAGYMLSWLFFYYNVWYLAIVWFLAVETFLVMYMRDGVLMFFNVFAKFPAIIEWQSQGVVIGKQREEKNLSIVCPLNAFLKPTEETTAEESVPLKNDKPK